MNFNAQVRTSRRQNPKSPSVNLKKKIEQLYSWLQCLTEKVLKRVRKDVSIAKYNEQLFEAPGALPQQAVH